uniref:Protein prenyltransferase alpha subunit repeat-containing protein 1 n=1 Tax=Lygus hesperus TaxID=30085 RepID=A0A146MEX0_LYGHE
MINPDITTFWNMRKDLINCGKLDPHFELHFAALVLSRKPKSSDVYTHRKWVLSKILRGYNDKIELLANEMNVCEVAADRYSNNYHAWTHRLWCLNQGIALQSKRLHFFLQELSWSQSWILRHVSDYSGFHYRQQVLSMLCDASPNNYPDNAAPLFSSIECDFKQFCDAQGINSNVEASSILKIIISELCLNTGMINDFVAHEALWYHRRFILHMFKRHAPSSCDSEANKTWVPFELCHSNGDGVPSEKNQKIEMEDVKLLTELQAYEASFLKQYSMDKTDAMSKKYAKRHLQWLTNYFKLNDFPTSHTRTSVLDR